MRERQIQQGRWLKGAVLALSLGLVISPTLAVLSDNTGQIQGRAPTASGELQVQYPDGTALGRGLMRQGQIPNQLTVLSTTTSLTLQDADGDSGLSAQIDDQASMLTWTKGGAPLAPIQLTVPFENNNNLSGKVLGLEASAPMTISSVTGIPLTAGAQSYTSRFSVLIPAFTDKATISKEQVFADGQDYAEVIYRLVDGNGLPVAGVQLSWTKRGSCTLQPSGLTTDANGEARVRVTNPVAGSCTFSYKYYGSAFGQYEYSDIIGSEFIVVFVNAP
ncbi:Ig-like domain-containing protein [Yersinia massiliensis]|uniref:Ig-like domain-containing protein n=1 Tax=Yersinia massiliensis TaxID=419257 RepID=UPI00030DA939|nr:Ig-like domain-containing protein [Yersinia massiliensis]MCB5307131.1 Ig-like domain-containing protein [Yersinia massiliensis]